MASLFKGEVIDSFIQKNWDSGFSLLTERCMAYHLCEWLTYDSAAIDREAPPTLILRNVVLRRPLVHFPVGTQFTEVSFNACGVLSLNIFAPIPHIVDLPGYNYLGRYVMDIGGHLHDSLFGLFGFCYTTSAADNTSVTTNGFYVKEGVAHEKTGLYPTDQRLHNIVFDLIGGNFSIGNPAINHPLRLKLFLREQSIPTGHLMAEYRNGHITKDEYRDTVDRRVHFKFDVKNPPQLEDGAKSPYTLDTSGFAVVELVT